MVNTEKQVGKQKSGSEIETKLPATTQWNNASSSLQEANNIAKKEIEYKSMLTEQMDELEKRFKDRLQKAEQASHDWMEQMEQRVTEEMETLLDTKLERIANVVGNRVSNKLTVKITKMLEGKQTNKVPKIQSEDSLITQETPEKERNRNSLIQKDQQGMSTTNYGTTSVIETMIDTCTSNNVHKHTDSIHDNKLESFNDSKG